MLSCDSEAHALPAEKLGNGWRIEAHYQYGAGDTSEAVQYSAKEGASSSQGRELPIRFLRHNNHSSEDRLYELKS